MESLEIRCQNFGLPDMVPFGEALVVSLSRPDRDAGNTERGLLFCYAMMHGFDPCCSDLFPFSDQCVGNLHKTCFKKNTCPQSGVYNDQASRVYNDTSTILDPLLRNTYVVAF